MPSGRTPLRDRLRPTSFDPAPGGHPLHLPHRRRLPPLAAILVRVGIALACLVVTATLVRIDADGYHDNTGRPVGWLAAFYYAAVSLSTTGYGDITPVTDGARLVSLLVITPLRFVFVIVLIGTTVEVLTRRSREEFRTQRWRRRVHDHTIVVGFGLKGRNAVATLQGQSTPVDEIVVISQNPEEIRIATDHGLAGIVGDATLESVLRSAGIERARRVVVATDADATSVLVTLTARRLGPTATIVTAARETSNADLLRQSGADMVITTAEAAGRLLGLALVSPASARVMEDLLENGRGLEVAERDITAAEVGHRVADLDHTGHLVLAVLRDGATIRFDQAGPEQRLQAGDRLVVIRDAEAGR